jgi:putative ABC transport system permease protein
MTTQAVDTQQWLQDKGYTVKHYKVASPGEHPHANITGGMFMIQKVFAVLCCFLSAVLVFNLMSAMLSKQLRQIGVMKAIGANNGQISWIYYRGVLVLGLFGLLISMPTAYFVSNMYVDSLAPMMNFDITSYQVPIWIIVLQVLLGIGIPMLSAYLPIKKASQMEIRETLLEYADDKKLCEQSWFDRLVFRLNFKSHPVRLAIRNSVRQKGRFLLTTGVLMIAASLLMASFNISSTMREVINVERHAKNWAVEIKLNQTMKGNKLESLFTELIEVTQTESFYRTSAAIIENDPDELEDNKGRSSENRDSKAHKVPVTITDLKQNSTMLNLPIIEGEWFKTSFSTVGNQSTESYNPVVVSQLVMDHLPYLKLGMTLDIEISGQIKTLTLIGVAQKIGPASIYTSGLLKSSHPQPNGIFLSSEGKTRAELNQLKKVVVQLAEENGIKLSYTSTAWNGAEVVEDHFQIVYSLMLLLTVIIIFIASNGIILTMTTNIIERTRENGVLKAIGASNNELGKMILSEAFLIAFLAWLVACVVTLPLSYGVAYWLGLLMLKTPLGLSLDPMIFIISLPIMMLITSLASLIPMGKIMRLPVREALVYE